MRRCPECGFKMTTDRKGHFFCNRCEYADEQIDRVAEINRRGGLDYNVHCRRKYSGEMHVWGGQ